MKMYIFPLTRISSNPPFQRLAPRLTSLAVPGRVRCAMHGVAPVKGQSAAGVVIAWIVAPPAQTATCAPPVRQTAPPRAVLGFSRELQKSTHRPLGHHRIAQRPLPHYADRRTQHKQRRHSCLRDRRSVDSCAPVRPLEIDPVCELRWRVGTHVDLIFRDVVVQVCDAKATQLGA